MSTKRLVEEFFKKKISSSKWNSQTILVLKIFTELESKGIATYHNFAILKIH